MSSLSWPSELTFGVFDAAIRDTCVPNPLVAVREAQESNGRVFMVLIDGGSALASSPKERYLVRGTVPSASLPSGLTAIRNGDLLRLEQYSVRRIANKEEKIISIDRLSVVGNSDVVCRLPREWTRGYPGNKGKPQTEGQQQSQQPPGGLAGGSGNPYSNVNGVSGTPYANSNNANASSGYPYDNKFQQGQQSGNPYNNSSGPNSMTAPPSNVNGSLPRPPPQWNNNTGDASGSSNYGPMRRTSNDGSSNNSVQGLYNGVDHTSGNMNNNIYNQPQQQQTAMLSMGGPGGGGAVRAAPYNTKQTGPVARRTDGLYVGIRDLTPYLGRWVVKARVINKGEPRTYSNQRGEGKLFSCELIDSSDEMGTIRCTFFTKAVDKFYPMLRKNEIYRVSRGTLKAANRKFNSSPHPFELHLGDDAEIEWLASDDPTIPQSSAPSVIPIRDMAGLSKNTSVSALGVLTRIGEISEIVIRATGQPKQKRELTIVDDSDHAIDVTLWAPKAAAFDKLVIGTEENDRPVVLLQNVRIDEYNGRKLSSVGSTDIEIDPQLPEAQKLKRWFALEGWRKIGQMTSLTTAGWSDGKGGGGVANAKVTIEEMRAQAMQTPDQELEDKGAWFSCQATLLNIDHERQYFWMACPHCGKKVKPSNNSGFGGDDGGFSGGYGLDGAGAAAEGGYCQNCDKDIPKATRRYLLTVEICDGSGSIKVTAMGDRGKAVMGGREADELEEVKIKGQSAFQRFSDFFIQRRFREYLFRIQARSETYNDETRLKYRLFGVEPLNGVIPTEPLNGANGVITCESTLCREALKDIEYIYGHIPRVAC